MSFWARPRALFLFALLVVMWCNVAFAPLPVNIDNGACYPARMSDWRLVGLNGVIDSTWGDLNLAHCNGVYQYGVLQAGALQIVAVMTLAGPLRAFRPSTTPLLAYVGKATQTTCQGLQSRFNAHRRHDAVATALNNAHLGVHALPFADCIYYRAMPCESICDNTDAKVWEGLIYNNRAPGEYLINTQGVWDNNCMANNGRCACANDGSYPGPRVAFQHCLAAPPLRSQVAVKVATANNFLQLKPTVQSSVVQSVNSAISKTSNTGHSASTSTPMVISSLAASVEAEKLFVQEVESAFKNKANHRADPPEPITYDSLLAKLKTLEIDQGKHATLSLEKFMKEGSTNPKLRSNKASSLSPEEEKEQTAE